MDRLLRGCFSDNYNLHLFWFWTNDYLPYRSSLCLFFIHPSISHTIFWLDNHLFIVAIGLVLGKETVKSTWLVSLPFFIISDNILNFSRFIFQIDVNSGAQVDLAYKSTSKFLTQFTALGRPPNSRYVKKDQKIRSIGKWS